MKRIMAIALGLMLSSAAVAQQYVSPYAYPQPEDTSEFFAVVEIPAGSITKYEIDAKTGHVIVDRYQSMPVTYPANYGSIPSSRGGDGDPLDVIVYTREPIVPGAMIKVRAVGILKMIDGGETDDKIVAVPADSIDPTYAGIKSYKDLPEIEMRRLEAFFRVYKQLPAAGKKVELNGFEDAAPAREAVTQAIRSYREGK